MSFEASLNSEGDLSLKNEVKIIRVPLIPAVLMMDTEAALTKTPRLSQKD